MILVLGLAYLGRLSRNVEELPSRLGLLAYLESLLLAGLAVAEVTHADMARNILSLVTGALIAPMLGFWFGWHFGRLERRDMASGTIGL